jgi:hypothetical protein
MHETGILHRSGQVTGCSGYKVHETGMLHRSVQVTGFTHNCSNYRILEIGILIDLSRLQDA